MDKFIDMTPTNNNGIVTYVPKKKRVRKPVDKLTAAIRAEQKKASHPNFLTKILCKLTIHRARLIATSGMFFTRKEYFVCVHCGHDWVYEPLAEY